MRDHSDDGVGKVRKRNLGKGKPISRCPSNICAVIYVKLKNEFMEL